MKKALEKALQIFGLKRNSRYVKDYLNEANMRSGIFMSAVIVVLELWLLIRQTQKYIIPTLLDPKNTYSFFRVLFTNTSNFWLLLSLGGAMLMYCLQCVKKIKSKRMMILSVVFAGISLAFCCLLPFEFEYNAIKFTSDLNTIKGVLKLCFYGAIVAFNVVLIIASVQQYLGKNLSSVSGIAVISLFALVCLMFGVMVSYGDFVSTKVFDGVTMNDDHNSYAYEHKQIICFLMMTIYVGCLLIWNPIVSIGILGVVFLGFFFALDGVAALGGRHLPEGDQVNYITFFISLVMVCISIYNQRVSEATKDEELEILATKDTLTGLLSFEYFITVTKRTIEQEKLKVQEWVFLFLDITNFKIFNDQRGFEEGNKFLHETAIILNEVFSGSIISRQSDDHFVVFTKNSDILSKLGIANREIGKLDLDIRPGIKAGAYVFRDKEEDPHQSVEKARYACAFLKRDAAHNYLEYDSVMHDNYRLVQYIVRHIEDAVEKERIIPFYQPVVWAKDGTLCSLEVLARWDDERFGFLPPNKFVPALEAAQLVHKLDIAVLEIVCKNLKHCILNDLPVIPVSINFSRMDFVLVNIVDTIESIVNKYKVPHDLIHIEITESALMENPDALKTAIRRFHEKGFSVWLDDFGSGYSSLNALKEFEFDVLKLDMEFLTGFSGNEKAKPLIKSAISLANLIGMTTVCEGVETKDQAEFLKTVNCDRLQGYHYGKPIPYEQIEQRIAKKELILSKDIKKGSKISLK